MKTDLEKLEASLEGLKNLRFEHSKRLPGVLTITDITTGEQLEAIELRLLGKSVDDDEAFTEAVAAACTNIFALIAELRELRQEAARAVEALRKIREEFATIASGKQEEVRNDFTSGESHGWVMAYLNLVSIIGSAADTPALAWLAQQRAEAAAKELEMLRDHIQEYVGPDDARDEIRRICANRIKDLRAGKGDK